MSNDTFTGNYTLNDYASSTVDLIAALQLSSPDILGVSLGSLIAQTIVVNYPSSVTHVVLSDTALTGVGLESISDPVNPSNVFVAAQGPNAAAAAVPSRIYPYYQPAGLARLCTNQILMSRNPVNEATAAQNSHQSTVGYDIAGPGGDEVSTYNVQEVAEGQQVLTYDCCSPTYDKACCVLLQ